MKKVIFNFSNLEKGGGAQIAQWLIAKILQSPPSFESIFFVSKALNEQIGEIPSNKVFIFDRSPVRSHVNSQKASLIAKDINANVVYTLFGPSGINFDCDEISGVANAWIASATIKDYISCYRLAFPLHMLKYYINGLRLAQKKYLIFETESSRSDFISRFKFPKENTVVISNTVNDFFKDYMSNSKYNRVVKKCSDTINLLYVSSYYLHKNFEMVPLYLLALSKMKVKAKIKLTLSERDFEKIRKSAVTLGVDDCLINLGYVAPKDLPKIYDEADIIFSASSVENFSATYAEAIYCRKPLLVADKKFSREICGDYAVYYNPLCSNSFAEKVISMKDYKFNDDLQIPNFISPEYKFESIIGCIEKSL